MDWISLEVTTACACVCVCVCVCARVCVGGVYHCILVHSAILLLIHYTCAWCLYFGIDKMRK